MKRQLASTSPSPEEGETAKQNKRWYMFYPGPIAPHLDSFNDVQAELQKLEAECVKEQMNIQRKFDEKKKPWFEKREALIDKVYGFWYRTFRNHPALEDMQDEDAEILVHLKKIDLDDNIDDSGSYKITFTFDEGAKEFLEPLTVVKHVKFDQGREYVEECTEIKWKPGKNPIEKVVARRNADENFVEWSFFEWLTKESDDGFLEDRVDLGEVIRRDIWHAPLPHYTAPGEVQDDVDEDEGDIDEDDADVGDEDDDGDNEEEDES